MRSMTGFSRINLITEKVEITVELRSLNSKNLSVSVNTHPESLALEYELRKYLLETLKRGRINCKIHIDFLHSVPAIRVNKGLAGSYIAALNEISQAFDIPDTTTTDTISRFRDVFHSTTEWAEDEGIRAAINDAVTRATIDLEKERRIEGEKLRGVLEEFLEELESYVRKINALKDEQKTYIKEKLEKFLEEIVVNPSVKDDVSNRLSMEIALSAEKADITEEIDRLFMHITRFRELMDEEEPVGMKMDFYCQEFLRELNTIASKTRLKEITHLVVEAKNTVNRIREQVQNVL